MDVSTAQVPPDDILLELARKLELYVKTRWYHLKGSPECFLGTEAVRWMVVEPLCPARTAQEAVALGSEMVKRGIISHVSLQRGTSLSFVNAPYFYCFNPSFRALQPNQTLSINNLQALGGRLLALIVVTDRPFQSGDQEVVYPHCFVGREAVKIMVESRSFPVSTPLEAVDLGNSLLAKGLVSYGVSPMGVANLPFKDEEVFYSFSPKLVPLLEDGEVPAEGTRALGPDADVFARPNEEDEAEGAEFISEKEPREVSGVEPSQEEHAISEEEELPARVALLEQQLSHKQALLDSTSRQLATSNSKLAECQAQLRARDEALNRRREIVSRALAKLQEQNEVLMHFSKEISETWVQTDSAR